MGRVIVGRVIVGRVNGNRAEHKEVLYFVEILNLPLAGYKILPSFFSMRGSSSSSFQIPELTQSTPGPSLEQKLKSLNKERIGCHREPTIARSTSKLHKVLK